MPTSTGQFKNSNMVRRSKPNTLGKSGVSVSVQHDNRRNVQRVWPWQTPRGKENKSEAVGGRGRMKKLGRKS